MRISFHPGCIECSFLCTQGYIVCVVEFWITSGIWAFPKWFWSFNNLFSHALLLWIRSAFCWWMSIYREEILLFSVLVNISTCNILFHDRGSILYKLFLQSVLISHIHFIVRDLESFSFTCKEYFHNRHGWPFYLNVRRTFSFAGENVTRLIYNW